jgi:acetyl-CoA carboxylase carboxyl transferase subunit alpha
VDRQYLPFEKPLEELSIKIAELKKTAKTIDIATEINALEHKLYTLEKQLYNQLSAWDTAQIARHLQRPKALDFIQAISTSFIELHGDRQLADDKSIVGGLAQIDHLKLMVIGQQKGHNTRENLERNFGMPNPEGYRKAARLMKLAEKFNLPLLTLVDTPGAYHGIGAEERNQSQAIAYNLALMSHLRTPIVSIVIGEGGSGGALALAVGDHLSMLEYAIYSVISPEGCASILWNDATKAYQAANILGITSAKLYELGLIDSIIPEHSGGAHVNQHAVIQQLKEHVLQQFNALQKFSLPDLLHKRFARIMNYGYHPATNATVNLDTLDI